MNGASVENQDSGVHTSQERVVDTRTAQAPLPPGIQTPVPTNDGWRKRLTYYPQSHYSRHMALDEGL